MAKRKLYFGCALFGLPEEHRKEMIALRESLREHFEILEFCPADTPPREIYSQDIHVSVAKADIMLAMCDKPSLGLGYEMAARIEKESRLLLALAHEDSPVSSLIRGVDHPKFEFKRYGDLKEVRGLLLDFEKKHFKSPA